ncbi:MAG: gliding motility lipoprotein GldH [Bacteroidota bacterium]|nr:gliding motility lipoprotein GldH [Bacteroidota bacterium]
MKKIILFYFLLITVVFTSCQKPDILDKQIDINPEGWDFNENFQFQFIIEDTSAFYDVIFTIRNTSEYKFSNIWVMIDKYSPQNIQSKKRYEYTLATPDGRWLGNGLGDLIDHKFIVDKNVKFQQKGKYKYIVNHEMRIDKLQNIQTIGLNVKKRN